MWAGVTAGVHVVRWVWVGRVGHAHPLYTHT